MVNNISINKIKMYVFRFCIYEPINNANVNNIHWECKMLV